MAVSWCWAFGQESATVLETQMEWDLAGGVTHQQPSNAFTYTYAGSPPRFSWAVDDQFNTTRVTIPVKAFVPAGWVTIAIYSDGTYIAGNNLMEARGALANREIAVRMINAAANTFGLYVDAIFKASFVMTNHNWHYVALQFDMSVNPWSGRVFVDGVAETATFTDAQNPETDGTINLNGITSGTRATYFAQIAVYNNVPAPDAAEVPRFVTRISPDADSSDTGTWVPPEAGGTAQVALTANDPFNNATFVEATTPASGNQVTTTFAASLTTQLGLAPANIDGVTGHSYSSGTAISAFAATGSAGAFIPGTAVVPDLVDTTYAFATAPLNPATGVAWAATAIVQLKYEIV